MPSVLKKISSLTAVWLFIHSSLFISLTTAYAAGDGEKSSGISKAVFILIMIAVFIVSTVITGFMTYKSRIKKIKNLSEESSAEKTKQMDRS